jgi:ATP-dependent helicase/nuclease subunit A
VHAVLQTIDLETGEGLADTATAHATAEGVPERADEIVRLVDGARGAPIVREAIERGRYWRELYVGSPIGDVTLEGFVDLLVDTDDGLVVVDYKTDASEVEALDDVVTRYRLQGAAYALAVEEVVGRPVTRCVFVFLHPDGAHERALIDLPEARAEVLERLAVPVTASVVDSGPAQPRP